MPGSSKNGQESMGGLKGSNALGGTGKKLLVVSFYAVSGTSEHVGRL